jgi:hypothetical protein
MLFFQGLPQVAERRRQLPVLVDVGVVQRRRLARQRHQVMQRVEHLHALGVASSVAGDDLATSHHLDALDIGLHRDRAESVRARHAVGVLIETHRLVFVHLGRLGHAGVERSRRQRQGAGTLALEALADVLLLPRLGALSVAQAASPQSSVQLGQVTHLGHRSGPVPLQELHPPLDARLLLRLAHQAKQRLEIVVASQRRVALVQLAAPSLEQVRNHALGIVPPELTRHALKERECFHQPVQDRLSPLGRQRLREGAVRVSPGHHQHRNLPAPSGEIDVDVTEVGFEALARIVVQRDERLALPLMAAADIEPHAFIATAIAVLLLQPPPQLARRMPLLARRLLVALEDRVNDRLEWIENRRRRPEPQVPLGFRRGEDLPDLTPRMVKQPGQRLDAQPVHKMRPSDASVLVHRDHPSPPCCWYQWCTSLQEALRGARFRRGSCHIGGPDSTRITT